MTNATVNEYLDHLQSGVSGEWEVSRFSVSQSESDFTRLRVYATGGREGFVPPGEYVKLSHRGRLVMTNTPDEVEDFNEVIDRVACRRRPTRVLVSGLGLGLVTARLLRHRKVTHVTVLEIAPEVVELVGPALAATFDEDRLQVVEADTWSWRPSNGERFDLAWHDIWPTKCHDNLREMTRLRQHHRPWVRGWQGCWAEDEVR